MLLPKSQGNILKMVRHIHFWFFMLECTNVPIFFNLRIGEQWSELLGSLFSASQSPDATQREVAFRIFATTPGIIERQHEDVVLSSFTKGFKDDDVAVSAIDIIKQSSQLISQTRFDWPLSKHSRHSSAPLIESLSRNIMV
jgi:hypothetical protein